MNQTEWICPRCGKCYTDLPAISRTDNETEICPDCGTEEAMQTFEERRRKNPKKRGAYQRLKEMEEVKQRNDERIERYIKSQKKNDVE